MDSAHFLLLCNADHPVRAGAGADGGFVCVWIRIGEVLFYSFSVTAQEKGERRWDGRGADRMAVEAAARRCSFSLCHHRCVKSAKVNASFGPPAHKCICT